MNRRNRKLVVAAVATAALVAGGSTLAFAGDDTAPSEALAASLRAGDTDDRDDDRGDDKGERDDDLRKLRGAEVTLQEAVAAALKAVPGTAESAELDDDGDRPAWDVDVLGKDGAWHEVAVDADSGDVLKRSADADDRDDKDDQDDQDDQDDDRDDRDDRDDDKSDD